MQVGAGSVHIGSAGSITDTDQSLRRRGRICVCRLESVPAREFGVVDECRFQFKIPGIVKVRRIVSNGAQFGRRPAFPKGELIPG